MNTDSHLKRARMCLVDIFLNEDGTCSSNQFAVVAFVLAVDGADKACSLIPYDVAHAFIVVRIIVGVKIPDKSRFIPILDAATPKCSPSDTAFTFWFG